MSLSMGMGPAWRHMRTDREAAKTRIERGTLRRVVGFARPHRGTIAVFLLVTVIDAGLVVVNPLLVQRLIDDGIVAGDGGLVTMLAFAMVGVALMGAVLSVAGGYFSARIGEGLIFDLRNRVFGHVQRQSPGPRPAPWCPA